MSACTSVPAIRSRPCRNGELDHEQRADDDPAEPLHELDLGAGRTAGGEHVVEDDHAGAGLDRVDVNLERIRAVLEVVARLDRLPGQLAGLPRGHEAAAERVGERTAEDEAARLGAEDHVGRPRAGPRRQPVDRLAEGRGSASSGITSLKTIPSLGKSGTSRISVARSSSLIGRPPP